MKQSRLFEPRVNQYKCIYADVPWGRESGGGRVKRGADRHYDLMSTREIRAMCVPLTYLVDPAGCYLFFWVTTSTVMDACQVIRSWGARYVTKVTWKKKGRRGLGQYIRSECEDLWICQWGKPGFKHSSGELPEDHPGFLLRRKDGRHQVTGLIEVARGEHSEKPEEFRQVVEWMSDGPRLELFARRESPGWDVFGDEVESSITLSDGGSQ